MRVIGMVFAEQAGTSMRWLVGVVVETAPDEPWAYVEIEPLACPESVVPTGVIAALHRQLIALRN